MFHFMVAKAPFLAGSTLPAKAASAAKQPGSNCPRQRPGFIQSAGAIGSAYHYTNGLPVLGFTNGSLSLLNGNLAQGITSPISLASETPATDGSASRLSVNTSSGLFQISVISPETGRPISVRGIVLQNQNYGAGLFLGPSETGSALLSP